MERSSATAEKDVNGEKNAISAIAQMEKNAIIIRMDKYFLQMLQLNFSYEHRETWNYGIFFIKNFQFAYN